MIVSSPVTLILNLPAQQHHNRISLGRDEAQQEDIATAAVVALQHRLPQWAIFMQGHFLGLGSHQVVYNVAKVTENKKAATVNLLSSVN